MNNSIEQKMKNFLIPCLTAILLVSCMSSKKLKKEQARYAELDSSYRAVQTDLKNCRSAEDENARKRAQMEAENDALNKQIAFIKENNNAMISQLKDLSVISS